jgi:DNA-binding NarL/FixJ family response regulator
LQEARKEFDPDGALDLVLVDADDPGASFDVLHSVRQSHPRTRLAALSATTNRAAILGILESGLFGFISKSQSDEEIFSAIHDILSGRIYVPSIMSQLDETIGSISAARDRVVDTSSPDREAHPEKLTPRQRQILPLLAKGMSNKEIARVLKIAEGTTKIHASGLLRVLGVRNRTEAAVAARQYIHSDQLAPSYCADPRRR